MTALNPLMRIGDQVAETVRLHRSVSRTEARNLARATLDLVGLPANPARRIGCPSNCRAASGSGWRSPWP